MIKRWYRSGAFDFPRSDRPDYNMLGYGIYFTTSYAEAVTYGRPAEYQTSARAVFDYSAPVPKGVQKKLLADPTFYDGFKLPAPSIDDGWYGGDDDGYSWDEFDGGYRIFKEPDEEEVARDLSRGELAAALTKLPAQYKDKFSPSDNALLYRPINGSYSHEIRRSQVFKSFYHLQLYLYEILGSLKAVTKKLRSSGVNALYYAGATTDVGERERSHTLVVFNKKVINMQSTKLTEIIRDELRRLDEGKSSNISNAGKALTQVIDHLGKEVETRKNADFEKECKELYKELTKLALKIKAIDTRYK